MMVLAYLIWNADPEIFSITLGQSHVTLRWYGLLFALGFVISQQILYYIYRKEGKPESDVDVLTVYMVVATIIGARLGHVLFYEPDLYLSDPVRILRVWEGGLASHGAAIAILIAGCRSYCDIGGHDRRPHPRGKFLQF
jgi:phosphatidylglycerol:prolipoprotein diacylglycerol transferase